MPISPELPWDRSAAADWCSICASEAIDVVFEVMYIENGDNLWAEVPFSR